MLFMLPTPVSPDAQPLSAYLSALSRQSLWDGCESNSLIVQPGWIALAAHITGRHQRRLRNIQSMPNTTAANAAITPEGFNNG
jgi:hypothetical protein